MKLFQIYVNYGLELQAKIDKIEQIDQYKIFSNGHMHFKLSN